MNTYLFKVLSLTAIITILYISVVFGQLAGSTTGARQIQPDTTAEAVVDQITADSGRYFKQGLLNLQDNRRSQARADFDKSVEVFLMSNVNVRTNDKLRSCYNQIVETVYRLEFASEEKPPQIKGLAITCGWNIENSLVDSVAKASQAPKILQDGGDNDLVRSVTGRDTQSDFQQVGFSEQKFEPSSLDELSKVELTQEEIAVAETPEARQQYVLIQQAIANKSFGFSFQMNPMVQQFIGYYQGRGRSTMEVGLARSGQFMWLVRRIFREEGVPENMAWLGQVESAWKPTARSWAAAAGLWQFIPGTGARFGLRQNGYVDERNSFEKATRASAQYLKFLANRYGGSWELAMAAYNSGEGNVDRAISRAGTANFWVAYPYLPRETRNYVPNILATILIANAPDHYGFNYVRPLPALQYELMRVPSSTNLGIVAQLSDTTVEYIRYLNPEFRSNTTPPEPYVIRVPRGKSGNVAALLKKMPNAATNVAVATVNRGESAQDIANRNGVAVAQVAIAPNSNKAIVQQGNKVREIGYNRPTNSPTASPSVSKSLQFVTAKAGESLRTLAARVGVAPAEMARLNAIFNLDAPLSAGRQLKFQPR